LLRRALVESGREYACARCGNTGEWLGRSLILEINHKDTNWRNNQPENLEFLCPNCHEQETVAQFHPHAHLNLFQSTPKVPCPGCGKPKQVNAQLCSGCWAKAKKPARRKVKDRPSFVELTELLKTETKIAIGKVYGVTDTTIRNWLKDYRKVAGNDGA
jgi:predicted RNA-binding Zn-ribbon protein involved in translation (DUF1610 family)